MPHAIWLAHSSSSISVPTVSGCSCRYSSIEPEHLTIAIARQTAGPYSPWGYERLKNKYFVSKFEIVFSCILWFHRQRQALQIVKYIYIYRVVISVCLFVCLFICPIITHETPIKSICFKFWFGDLGRTTGVFLAWFKKLVFFEPKVRFPN